MTPAVWLLAIAVASTACSTKENMQMGTPDAAPIGVKLTIPDPPGSLVTLAFGERGELVVSYVDDDGNPIPGAQVSFALVADPTMQESDGGSTLSTASATTDATGNATVDVVAGAAQARFRVVAQAANASPATFIVSVSNTGFATLEVTPRYVGARDESDLTSVDVRIYSGGVVCASLMPAAPPAAPYPPVTFDRFDQAAEFDALSAGDSYAALARGLDSAGRVLASGCIDLAEGQLRGGGTISFDLQVDDLPISLSATYALTSRIDLSPLELKLVAFSTVWKVAACPRGAAQLLLDCAIDALDAGDPLDCVVENPGAIAQSLQAARGTIDVNGCRAATVGNAQSLDARVMAALTPGSASPAAALAGASASLASLLGTLTISSDLSPAVTWATHTLVGLSLGVGGQTYQIDPTQSSRPVVTATAAMTLTGTSLTLGDHAFTLHLGDLLHDAFDAVVLVPAGVNAPVERLGDVIAATAISGQLTGCAAVSQVACSAAGLAVDCLTTACTAGITPLDAELLSTFSELDTLGLDFRLQGVATIVDADDDLIAEGLTGGIWTATVTLSDGTTEDLSGAFSGEKQ